MTKLDKEGLIGLAGSELSRPPHFFLSFLKLIPVVSLNQQLAARGRAAVRNEKFRLFRSVCVCLGGGALVGRTFLYFGTSNRRSSQSAFGRSAVWLSYSGMSQPRPHLEELFMALKSTFLKFRPWWAIFFPSEGCPQLNSFF